MEKTVKNMYPEQCILEEREVNVRKMLPTVLQFNEVKYFLTDGDKVNVLEKNEQFTYFVTSAIPTSKPSKMKELGDMYVLRMDSEEFESSVECMVQVIVPKNIKDKLLNLNIGDIETIIIPVEKDYKINESGIATKRDEDDSLVWTNIMDLSIVKKRDMVYLIEDFHIRYRDDYKSEEVSKFGKVSDEEWQDADDMTPEQSRFHGLVMSVKCIKVSNFNTEEQVNAFKDYRSNIEEPNCRIDVSKYMDDYVFEYKIKRIK